MCNNDLSDNGKSFEFGYDSSSDSYGYYKNGTFTEFGGGGGSMKPTYIVGWGGTYGTNGKYIELLYSDNYPNYVINSGASYSYDNTYFTGTMNYTGLIDGIVHKDCLFISIYSATPVPYSAGSSVNVSGGILFFPAE